MVRSSALHCFLASIVALIFAGNACASRDHKKLEIPEGTKGTLRLITVDDMARLRHVDALEVAPDGRRFAILVHQGDPVANDYRMGWFVGSTEGGALTYVGDGGEAQLRAGSTGKVTGSIESGKTLWSADGRWIVYTLKRDGEVQLWRSRADGSLQEQITHNAADVLEFAWKEDGQVLYFTVGTSRAELRARDEAMKRNGYQYDEDLNTFTDFMLPQISRTSKKNISVWTVALKTQVETLGGESERIAFGRTRARYTGGIEATEGFARDAVAPPVAHAGGALAWFVRSSVQSVNSRLMAFDSTKNPLAITCAAIECSGIIQSVWWSEDGKRVLFWRREGVLDVAAGFYAWSPKGGTVSTILRTADDYFQHCSKVVKERLICVRETPILPAHLATIDLRSGALRVVADINPEFRNIRLGDVERIEWDTPRFLWNEPGGQLNGLYPKRAFGYILYPPDFDHTKKYPVVIEPYSAVGFDNQGNLEHPLHAYAASGFVVLHTQFPMPIDVTARLGASYMKQLYSAELNFPHLTMLMESTVRALDTLAARGFVDELRVGIGGVSHGTFVPLYMLQKYDRIAAISISSSTWGPFEYYWPTRRGREAVVATMGKVGYEDWLARPDGKGQDFWRRIDIADHVDNIEAPILMNLPAFETYGVLRLIRHLSEAGKAYDAYVFPEETHVKWQPAHLYTIMNRNLDWFRFWLQGYEDPSPAKAEQYLRWRNLRALQKANHARATGIRE